MDCGAGLRAAGDVVLGRGMGGARAWARRGVLAACALLTTATGGCAEGKLTEIKDLSQFRRDVLGADRPVLVDFYKGGCPTCVALEGTLDTLADAYEGRVVFARFELMKPTFTITCQEIWDQYGIRYFPTVVLFVNGQERTRWVMHYRIDDYRKGLDDALRAPTATAPTTTASAPAP